MILPTVTSLENISGLVPWLAGGEWRKRFAETAPPEAWENLPCKSIRISDESKDAVLILVDYEKNAERLRETSIYLHHTYDKQSRSQKFRMTLDCDCGSSTPCLHAAAALEALAGLVGGKTPVAPPPRKSATPIPMTARTREWIALVKSTTRAAAPIPPPAPTNKFLAYCIELHADLYRLDRETLHFTPRVATRGPTGVTVEPKVAAADPFAPAKYMAPEDTLICAHYHQRTRDSHQFASLTPLRGSGWEKILPAAMATERLLFGTPPQDRQPSKDFRVVTAGDPVPVEPAWEIDPFGNARPILKLPSATFQPILTDPPRYIDIATCQMGLLLTPLSTSMLTAWHDGPRIPAGEIDALSREIIQITPDTPLSAPSEKPAQRIVGRDPLPCLEISEILIGPYLKRHFGGIVTFRYPDMPPVGPLAADLLTSTHWMESGQRVVLERDREAEAERLSQLRAHGILPLHEIVPAHDLTDKTRHVVTLDQLQTEAFPWLEFLESPACAKLKAAGWTVSTHKKAGLIVHDVTEFFPTLTTDPSKTLDWFRFDVTAEAGGKRMSLVPQIARAIREDWLVRYAPPQEIPETLLLACDKPSDGFVRFPAQRFLEMLEQVRHLFEGPQQKDGSIRIDRLGAARIADALAIDDSETNESLAALGRNLRDIQGLPATPLPKNVKAELRPYQLDGFRWLQFLSNHGLHGILADDMGLGKTLQTLAHLAAEAAKNPGKPSLVVAPTSVVPNWAAEARKFTPHLKIVVLHGSERSSNFSQIPEADVVFTSYPLLVRDIAPLFGQQWHIVALDEAHYIKNPKALTARAACQLRAEHRICLSGTPMENHLGEMWSLMRFLMPGYLGDEKSFNTLVRKPIERDQSRGTQLALNRRISPLILRRTKDQVATELPAKTTLVHRIDLTDAQSDLYESVRAAMDDRVRHAITEKGLAKSHIIVLDALLKLRQICCHPQLLKSEAAQRVTESAKLEYLTAELLPTLIEEGRRILLFSQFTSMLALIEEHLKREGIPYLQLTGQTKDRAILVEKFQTGEVPIFLISLKAGGTGLNLTAADTIIHYDPWWNPAAENQATDRAHRIGQTKPVFVHKLVCTGTIEERILELQVRKDKLVKALLSEETTALKIDAETLSHLFGT